MYVELPVSGWIVKTIQVTPNTDTSNRKLNLKKKRYESDKSGTHLVWNCLDMQLQANIGQVYEIPCNYYLNIFST